MSTSRPSPVLYAEDDENDRALLELAFQLAGVVHPVVPAPDGAAALDYLVRADAGAAASPCLILLDVMMPKLTGLELLARIRQRPTLAGIPIVMFSSSFLPVDVDRARELGADDYVQKPSSMAGLVAFVRGLDARWLSRCRSGT